MRRHTLQIWGGIAIVFMVSVAAMLFVHRLKPADELPPIAELDTVDVEPEEDEPVFETLKEFKTSIQRLEDESDVAYSVRLSALQHKMGNEQVLFEVERRSVYNNSDATWAEVDDWSKRSGYRAQREKALRKVELAIRAKLYSDKIEQMLENAKLATSTSDRLAIMTPVLSDKKYRALVPSSAVQIADLDVTEDAEFLYNEYPKWERQIKFKNQRDMMVNYRRPFWAAAKVLKKSLSDVARDTRGKNKDLAGHAFLRVVANKAVAGASFNKYVREIEAMNYPDGSIWLSKQLVSSLRRNIFNKGDAEDIRLILNRLADNTGNRAQRFETLWAWYKRKGATVSELCALYVKQYPPPVDMSIPQSRLTLEQQHQKSHYNSVLRAITGADQKMLPDDVITIAAIRTALMITFDRRPLEDRLLTNHDDAIQLAGRTPGEMLAMYRQWLRDNRGGVQRADLVPVLDRMLDDKGTFQFLVSAKSKAFAEKLPVGFNKYMYGGEFKEAFRLAWAYANEANDEETRKLWVAHCTIAIVCYDQTYNKRVVEFVEWVNDRSKPNPVVDLVDGNSSSGN